MLQQPKSVPLQYVLIMQGPKEGNIDSVSLTLYSLYILNQQSSQRFGQKNDQIQEFFKIEFEHNTSKLSKQGLVNKSIQSKQPNLKKLVSKGKELSGFEPRTSHFELFCVVNKRDYVI